MEPPAGNAGGAKGVVERDVEEVRSRSGSLAGDPCLGGEAASDGVPCPGDNIGNGSDRDSQSVPGDWNPPERRREAPQQLTDKNEGTPGAAARVASAAEARGDDETGGGREEGPGYGSGRGAEWLTDSAADGVYAASSHTHVTNPVVRSDCVAEVRPVSRGLAEQDLLPSGRGSVGCSHDSRQPGTEDEAADGSLSLTASGSSRRDGRGEIGPDGVDFSDPRQIFKWLSPYSRRRYPVVFTPMFVMVAVILFSFMAGVYPVFELEMSQGDASKSTGELLAAEHWRPSDLTQWATFSADRTFPFEFLLGWGGRYGPKIDDGDWWRWFTSPFVHQSFQHVLGNMALLAALAGHLERNHGTWRIILVYLLSSVGGNLMSAAFEDGCVVVVGSSGAVFGFVGLFAGDAVLNFDSIRRPLVRIGILLIFVAFFIVTTVNTREGLSVSHFSHLGGLLCGLFPPFLFLPNLKRQRSERAKKVLSGLRVPGCVGVSESMSVSSSARPSSQLDHSRRSRRCVHPFTVLGVLVLVLVFVALPMYLYLAKLPRTVCNTEGEDARGDSSTTSMASTW